MKFGFALLTYSNPKQISFLTHTLRTLFPTCAIVCHHNFSSEPHLNLSDFPDVDFVRDFVDTRWGHSSCIEASMKAFNFLLSRPAPPDWFYLLSGSDYPIKSGAQIEASLANSITNVFISYHDGDTPAGKLRRYHDKELPHFPAEWQCHAGEHWFTADRKAISHLIDVFDNQPALMEHYKQRERRSKRPVIPEESYYHTVFCNSRHLVVENNCLRYIDWSDDTSSHPKTLTVEDSEAILRSRSHFARKVDPDTCPELLNVLRDAVLKPA